MSSENSIPLDAEQVATARALAATPRFDRITIASDASGHHAISRDKAQVRLFRLALAQAASGAAKD